MALAKVWVFAEAEGDKPATSTLELLTKAREIADTVEAVYVGPDVDTIAPALGEYGAAKVFALDPEGVLSGVAGAAALAPLIEANSPDLVLFAQTYDGRDALARLSVKLDRPVITNGTALSVDGDSVTVGNAIFGGNTLVDTKFAGEKPFRWNAETLRIMQTPEMQARLLNEGARFIPMSPEQFAAFVRSEIAKWAPVVRASGARVD